MPPPSFSHLSSAAAGGGTSQQTSAATTSLNDVPRVQRLLVREVIQTVRASLLWKETKGQVSGGGVPSGAKSTAAAYQAIARLLGDSALEKRQEDNSSTGTANLNASSVISSGATSSGSAGNHKGGADDPRAASGNSAPGADSVGLSLRAQVSAVLETNLINIFSDEMDQEDSGKCQLLVSFLYTLQPILDPLCIVREWWDVLLRPILKDASCHPEIARRAQKLVIWTMSCTPLDLYVDEPPPSPIWPAPMQSAVAAEQQRSSKRVPGTAPYPISSTRATSPGRSSVSGESRRSTLYGTIKRSNEIKNPLWRFTSRIFDMYTSEASSATIKDVEDDDIQDVNINEANLDDGTKQDASAQKDFAQGKTPQTTLSDVSLTWKGNLEAIILSFGEEKPKSFFHHLSDAFADPQARVPILLLLTIFFRISSLHAYHVVSTPFVRILVLSLQLDTSKLSTALGVSALVTLIPHIPNWIANGGAGGLPALLSILARIIDWRRLGQHWEERTVALDREGIEEVESLERISRRLRIRQDIHWERLDTRSDTANPSPPNAELLFMFLYGIFPCNVIRFLRAPLYYLRRAEYESPFEVDWEDIIDEEAVQQKSAPILRRHILHPSLVDMDAESELSSKQRWSDHDAADITAECVCLNIQQAFQAASMLDHPQEPNALEAFSKGEFENISEKASSFNRSTDLQNYPRVDSSSFDAPWQHKRLVTQLLLSESTSTIARAFRPRSLSDNLGERPRMFFSDDLQSSQGPFLAAQAPRGAVQDTNMQSKQPRWITKPASTHQLLPSRHESDGYLSNHIHLRYGVPSGITSQTPGIPMGAALSRSSSMRSQASRSTPLARSSLAQSALLSAATTSGYQDPASSEGGETQTHLASRSTSVGPATTVAREASSGQRTKSVLKEEVVQNIAYLKQENLQLRNELNYEIGQKDQMVRHIGRIHRDRIKDTAREDERQNLYQLVRTLRAQLKTVRENAERSKAEAISFKSRHSRWEDELNAKVKQFREERRIWTNEVRHLQIVKEDREALIAKLEKQLHENADEVFEMRQQCKRDAQKVQAIQAYEDRIRRLEACLELWNDDMRKFAAQQRELDMLASQYEEAQMLLATTNEKRRRATSAAIAADSRSESLLRQLQTANEATSRLRAVQTRAFSGSQDAAEGAAEDPLFPAGGRHRTQTAVSEQGAEEKSRLRARVEQLESELLDMQAQREERQVQMLFARLQSEREAATRASGSPNTPVSPMATLGIGDTKSPSPLADVAPLYLDGSKETTVTATSSEDHAAESEANAAATEGRDE